MNDTNRHARPHHRRAAPAPLAAAILFVGSAQAATITVDTTVDELTDNAVCSLREAVINANNDNQSGADECAAGYGTDLIVFDPALDGTAIGLAIAGTGEDAAATGDLDLTDNVVVRGNGGVVFDASSGDFAGRTVINGNDVDRVFDVHGTARATIEQLVVRNAEAPEGAAIRSDATSSLTLRHAIVGESLATGATDTLGGGIHSAGGALVLEHSAVAINGAEAVGSGNAYGGGISVLGGTLTLRRTALMENLAWVEDGRGFGGAIMASSGVTIEIDEALIIQNTVLATGGSGDARGGALYLAGGTATVDRATIAGNGAGGSSGASAWGGGIHSNADLTLANVTLNENTAEADGGIASSGALRAGSGTLTLHHVTLVDNHAVSDTAANGVHGGLDVDGATVATSNSVIAANTDSNGGHPNCRGSLASNGYNLIGDDTGCSYSAASGDRVGDGSAPIDPMLDSLADNGGGFVVGTATVPQGTLAPLDGSPVVDAANPAAVAVDTPPACDVEDQRGGTRPVDGDGDGGDRCDIGAFEVGSLTAGGGGSGGGGGGALGWPLALLFVAVLAWRCRDAPPARPVVRAQARGDGAARDTASGRPLSQSRTAVTDGSA